MTLTAREKILHDALTAIWWGGGDGRVVAYVNPEALQQTAKRALDEFDAAVKGGA